MRKLLYVVLLCIFSLVCFLIVYIYKFVPIRSGEKSSKPFEDCSTFLDRNTSKIVGCGFSTILGNGQRENVVRVVSFEKEGNNYFLTIARQGINGQWLTQKLFVTSLNSITPGINVYKYSVPFISSVDGSEVEYFRIGIDQAVGFINGKIGKESIVFLSSGVTKNVGFYKYMILDSIVFYEKI